MGILDLSKQDGGAWYPDHICHQNGCEVDVRYIRNDGQEIPLNIKTDSLHYDIDKTVVLINSLINASHNVPSGSRVLYIKLSIYSKTLVSG